MRAIAQQSLHRADPICCATLPFTFKGLALWSHGQVGLQPRAGVQCRLANESGAKAKTAEKAGSSTSDIGIRLKPNSSKLLQQTGEGMNSRYAGAKNRVE